jgi:hypothetical protein
VKEKYNSKAFIWYRRKHQSLCDRTFFDEPKPAKTFGEAWQRTKDKSIEAVHKVGDKTSSLAHRIDQKLLKSKTVGGIWKKIKG